MNTKGKGLKIRIRPYILIDKLWLKISQHTERFIRIKEPLGFYWAGGGNRSSSDQAIKNCREFQSRYLEDRMAVFPAHFYYGIGRSYFHLRRYDDAFQNLVNSAFDGPTIIRLKSIFTIIEIIFISMYNKMFRRD